MADQSPSTEQRTDERIHAQALERFKVSENAESDIRKKALEDLKFSAGDQWPEDIKKERELDARPCLVINRLPQAIRQVTNDQRQNRPSIKVYPVDDKADVETAGIFQGIIRHIEYNSNADVAYDTGFESAVRAGLGYLRVVTDYINPKSFDQEIFFKRVRNPASVFFDPNSEEPDGSDAEFAFITDDMTPAEYKRAFPKSKLAQSSGWEAIGNQKPDWVSGETVRIAEYFYKEYEEDTLCLLSTGESILKSELPSEMPQGVVVVSERSTQISYVNWCKLNGVEILEKTRWPGKWIPIVPIYGEELFIDGKRSLAGIVRNAKDAQRMSNYWISAETEAIALAPKTPFIGAVGQFEGHEEKWATANRKNHAYLEFNPIDIQGTPLPAPARNIFEPAVQAITNARMLAADDLKATTGIYDASLGARSNETSGIAIRRRTAQAQTSNFHFVDNLSRSIRHAGRILVDLIPKIYDTPRAARIIGVDGEQKIVRVNEIFKKNGEEKKYDLSVGLYDVVVDVGPSYATKRQEAVESMLEVTKSYPQLAQFAGDLLVKNMDWPGSQEFADRIKKTLPPGITDSSDEEVKIPPQIQAQMGQMNQMIEILTAKLNEASDTLRTKQMELESKERIETMKAELDATKTLATLQSKEAVALLTQEIAAIKNRMGLLDFDKPVEPDSAESSGGIPAFEAEPQNPIGGGSPSEILEGNP